MGRRGLGLKFIKIYVKVYKNGGKINTIRRLSGIKYKFIRKG